MSGKEVDRNAPGMHLTIGFLVIRLVMPTVLLCLCVMT